jgi:hypothetical protein
VSFEDFFRHYAATHLLPNFKPLFWMVTVSGQLGGQVGPLFLLAPLALLGLRSAAGRRCLLGALVFLLPYASNVDARFLIPALPCLALAMAMSFEFSPIVPILVVAAAGVLAWPRVIDRYRAPSGGWQIATVPWKAALGIIPAQTWLSRDAGYRLTQTINRSVPADKRIWSTVAVAQSYTVPDVLVYYYSAECEQIQDILLSAIHADKQPLWDWRFTFPARPLGRVRVLQTAASDDAIWSIGETRFFHLEEEANPSHADAQPFPWTVSMALDRNPVTRWRSWEPIHPGMHVDFDFEIPVTLDRVDLYCSHDQPGIDLKLDGIDAHVEKIEGMPTGDLRKLATRTIQARGIDYLLIGDDYLAAADIAADPSRWGLQAIASEDRTRLYQIQ